MAEKKKELPWEKAKKDDKKKDTKKPAKKKGKDCM